jgi:hypothetical protein
MEEKIDLIFLLTFILNLDSSCKLIIALITPFVSLAFDRAVEGETGEGAKIRCPPEDFFDFLVIDVPEQAKNMP